MNAFKTEAHAEISKRYHNRTVLNFFLSGKIKGKFVDYSIYSESSNKPIPFTVELYCLIL